MMRNKSIDGLRGVCAILLIIYHMIVMYSKYYLDRMVSNFMLINHWGEVFSLVFLIISAYFLYSVPKNEFSILEYYRRKAKRLWPTYFLAITITFIVTRFFYLPGRTGSIMDYLLNIFFINGFIGSPYIDGAHWYMTTLVSAVLIMGIIKRAKISGKPLTYLIWLAVFMIVKVLSKLINGTGAQVIYIIGKLLGNPYVGALCVGIGLHMLVLEMNKAERKNILSGAVVFGSGLIVSFLTMDPWRIVGVVVGVLLIILCALYPNTILSRRIFVFLGSVSYPVYLIHQNIGYIIQNELVKTSGQYTYWYALIAGIIAVLLGIALWYCEKWISGQMEHIGKQRKKESST